jgi:hypothetical protein
MALRLAHVRSMHRPSRHVHYVGRLSRKREDLDQKEQARLDQLLNLEPSVQTVYAFLQAFLSMVRQRKHQDLRSWMEQAIRSGIPELGSFVAGIERDYDAVHAALLLPWRKARHRGQSQQAQNTQTRDVWSCGLCSPATTALTRRLTGEELLAGADEGDFPQRFTKNQDEPVRGR